MDLLGGYGSDNSKSSSSSSSSNYETRQDRLKMKTTTASRNKNQGTKLISLSSVLPPHILEQLQNGGNGYDSEEDDEERAVVRDDPSSPLNDERNQRRHPPTDSGLALLLEALSDSAPAAKQPTGAKPTPPSNNIPVGLSFLKTSTELVRHPTPAATEHQSSHEVLVERFTPSGTVAAPNSHPPRPLSFPGSDLPKPIASYGRRGRQAASPRSPAQSVPQSGLRLVVMDPPVAASLVRPTQPTQQETAVRRHSGPQARKRSRKQMEQDLRGGNMDAIADSEVEHVRQQAPDSYTFPQEQHQNRGHGIKVTPVAMYDTKQGQGVVGAVSGKARGKNQINYLMASAAAYEADQQVATSTQKMKIYRANAKQKYGW